MKRSCSLFVLIFYLAQLAWSGPVAAQAIEPQQAEIIEQKLNLPTDPKDAEFVAGSQRAEKFFFEDFPRDLYGGLKTSFWGWGALAFALGAGLSGGVYPLDDNLQNSFQPDALFGDTTNDVVNYALAPYTYFGVSLLLWISGGASDHPKLALTGRALTEALILSMSITWIGKLAFRRQRPDGGNFSFPSGHATAAFTAAGVLTEFYGWKGALPAYALAGFISVSRVDHYDHFLSDVLMGAVIGSVLGYGTAKYLKKENRNFFITPEVSRDHAALQFHYVF